MHLDNSKNTVVAYTDGSAWWKTQEGGIGVYLTFGKKERHFYKGFKNTSIGRQELLGLIFAMKLVTNKNYKLIIYCDSKYAINTINKGWIETWSSFHFIDKKNVDLLKGLWKEYQKFPKGNVKLRHVKGHIGINGNEKADELAKKGFYSSDKIFDAKNYPIFIEGIK